MILDGVDPDMAAALRRASLDTVDGAFAHESGDDLVKPGLRRRRRTRITLTDAGGATHELYLKRYGGASLGRRIRRWIAHRRIASEAIIEAGNIRAVRALGVATMDALAVGQKGGRSYIVVTRVPGDALERCGRGFLDRHAAAPEAIERFTLRLAGLVHALHAGGHCHRDLYASHVFLDERGGAFDLALIDLARAIRPLARWRRWRVKDLAQLKYSMPADWVERYWGAFLAAYARPFRDANAARMDAQVDRKVRAMRRRAEKKNKGAT